MKYMTYSSNFVLFPVLNNHADKIMTYISARLTPGGITRTFITETSL